VSTRKAFDIPKRLFWDACEDVRPNGGSAGVDGQCVEAFEANLKNNLYKILNRLCSGSYMPPPVLRVEIPKADGGVRQLGIPTIGDRIAQAAVHHRKVGSALCRAVAAGRRPVTGRDRAAA